MVEILSGALWNIVSRSLTTDDAVRCRTVACSWNVGSRCGDAGELYVMLLKNDPYEKHRQYDAEGNKLHTMLKKNNPIMEGVRKWGLHELGDAVLASTTGTQEPPSLMDAIMWFTGNQIADTNLGHACGLRRCNWTVTRRCTCPRPFLETPGDLDSMSCGSMSADLGELWRQGYPRSPMWDGDLEPDSADEDGSEEAAGDEGNSEGGIVSSK